MDSNERFQHDSLLYYMYFGVTKKDVENDSDMGMKRCIKIAYRDLCRTLEYTYSDADLNTKDKDFKKSFVETKQKFREDCMPAIIAKEITTFVEDCTHSENDFDKWHKDTCEKIVAKAREYEEDNFSGVKLFKDNSFTYGQAQKWLNMALKNMLIMNLEGIVGIEQFLHVPVDSYIIYAASMPENEPILDQFDVEGLGVAAPEETWSNISKYEDYMRFQCDVRKAVKGKGLTPIEWEGMAWIAVAKMRANDS